MICKKCGRKIEEGAKVCVKCGAKLDRPYAFALAAAGKVPLVDEGEAQTEEGLIYAFSDGIEELPVEDGLELEENPEAESLLVEEQELNIPDPPEENLTVFPRKRRRPVWRDKALQLFYAASVFIALVAGLFGGYYLASRNRSAEVKIEDAAGAASEEDDSVNAPLRNEAGA
jgi:hypothetical protein